MFINMVEQFIAKIKKIREDLDKKHEDNMKSHGYRDNVKEPVVKVVLPKPKTVTNKVITDKPKPKVTSLEIDSIIVKWDNLKKRDKVIFLNSIGIPRKSVYKYVKNYSEIEKNV